MKIKFLNIDQYENNMEPKERFTFAVESPFSAIKFPLQKTLFVVWHGSSLPLVVRGAQGTIYVCRLDFNDSNPLNFDVYSIYPKNKNFEIIKVPEKELEYHHATDVPLFIKNRAPQWVINKINTIRKND